MLLHLKIWLYIPAILCSIHSFSQERVRITHVPAPDTLRPGAYVTLVFKSSEAEDSVRAELHTPEGWQLLSQMRIPTANGINWLYSLASKSNSLAGWYPVKFDIFTRGIRRDSATVHVLVREVSRIEIVSVSPPEYLKEGETFLSSFVVNNQGNRTENLVFSATGGSLETDSARLAPGESVQVTMKRVLPLTGQSGWILSQNLAVKVEGRDESYRQYISVPVYSSKPVKTDNYLRFPVEVGAGFLQYQTGDITSTGYQYSVKGRGNLDFKRRHTLDFEARGPNQRFFPVLGTYDHYSVSYAYKDRFRVTAGDFQLAFNHLMEWGRYGRGGQVEARGKKLGFRAFYQNPRLFPTQKDSYGGAVSLFLKNGDISASYFSKDMFTRNQWLTSRMIGLSARVKRKTVHWEAEGSVGSALGQYDIGVFNRLHYNGRKFNAGNQLIYTGKNYFGFYTNSRLLVTNIGYNFHRKAGIGVNHNYMLTNPSLDITVFNTSPFVNTLMAYFTFAPTTRHRFFLNYSVGDRKDRQQPSTFDYHENTGNFFYTYEGTRMRWNHQARYGFTRNNLVEADGLLPPRRTYASTHLQPSFRLWRKIWLGGFAEYQYTSRFSATDRLEHLFFWGGNLSLVHKQVFRLNLMYRNSYAPDELYQSRSYLNALAVLDLRHHRLSFQGGSLYHPDPAFRQQNTLFFSLTYTLKLNVPLARKRNIGRVVGQVTGVSPDISTAGLLIRLGGKEYLTDAEGKFAFNNLAEDKYLLTLQRLQAANGVIPLVKIPLQIQVKKDSVTYLEIPLSKTGGVEGRVTFSGEAAGRKPLVLLKLYNEESSYLTDLKEGGVFSFKEILPGSWKLKVILRNPAYEVDVEEQAVALEPDIISEVKLVIRPRERKIFFSNQNFQISLKE